MNNFPDYLYPVLPSTLKDFSSQITTPILTGQSVSFVFSHFQGGERAWIRFLFDHPNATDFQNTLKNYRLILFDPTEVIDSSHSAFLYHLLTLLTKHPSNYSSLSQQQIINQLRDHLNAELPKTEIVIFFLKLNSFPNMTPILGNLLYSLWRPHKRGLHFVTTLTPESILPQLPDLVGDFTETLTENVHLVPPLSTPNLQHSIMHWEHILNHQFTSEEKSSLLKYSQGSPYISKILCQNLAQKYTGIPDHICKQIVHRQFGRLQPPQNLKSLSKNSFTPQENSVINLLLDSPSQIISRDIIATALWGNLSDEKYSDWAIDKFISLIRQKMANSNCSSVIKTIKNQGYLLEI